MQFFALSKLTSTSETERRQPVMNPSYQKDHFKSSDIFRYRLRIPPYLCIPQRNGTTTAICMGDDTEIHAFSNSERAK